MYSYHRIPSINSEKDNLIHHPDGTDNPPSKKFSKGKLLIVPFLFSLFLSEGIIVFVINEWTRAFIHHQYFVNDTSTKNSSACEDKNSSDPVYMTYTEVQHRTSVWVTYFKVAEYVPTIIASFILPSYTDTFGRRFLFITGSLTMLIKSSIVTLTIRFYKSPTYIVFAHLIQGCSGTSFSLYSVSFLYMADLTTPNKNRVLGIVAIEAVLMSSRVVAGFLSVYLVETVELGYFNTALICSCLTLIGFIQGLFLLPESLSQRKRITRRSFLTMIKRVSDFYISQQFKGVRLCYVILLLSFSFAEITSVNRSPLQSLFLSGQPFCWDLSKICNFLLAQQAIQGAFGLISLPLLQKLMSNEMIAIISTLSKMTSFIIEGYADTEKKIYLVVITGLFSFLGSPIILGLLSSITMSNKQGSMFASVAIIQAVITLISTLSENSVYLATLSIMNGFMFLVLAGFCVMECILLIVYCFIKPYNLSKLSDKPHQSNNTLFDKNCTTF